MLKIINYSNVYMIFMNNLKKYIKSMFIVTCVVYLLFGEIWTFLGLLFKVNFPDNFTFSEAQTQLKNAFFKMSKIVKCI